jgi:AraC-like DNA-binding protein
MKDYMTGNKQKSTLHVKNMVCPRCIRVVREELEKLGIVVNEITLGEVKVYYDPGVISHETISKTLEANGFELLLDKKARIIEHIKSYIISIIHYDDPGKYEQSNFSDLLEKELNMDYHYLTSLFSSVENITIEQFIILQKIEKAKELVKYGEMTLSEIAYRLGYKSVQHLSNQFKKVTGLTASQFKKMTSNLRKPLDSVN